MGFHPLNECRVADDDDHFVFAALVDLTAGRDDADRDQFAAMHLPHDELKTGQPGNTIVIGVGAACGRRTRLRDEDGVRASIANPSYAVGSCKPSAADGHNELKSQPRGFLVENPEIVIP